MIKTNFRNMPLEAVWFGMEVTRFYKVARDLGLVQPETGLNFQDYSLAIFHCDMTVSEDDGKTWITKGASIYASVKTELFRSDLFDDTGKQKPDADIELEQMHHFIAIYDEDLPGGIANAEFLSAQNIARERKICYSRKIYGQRKSQRLIFRQKTACDFAHRIARTIFKLDYPTDESAQEDAKNVLNSIMKKKD